MFKFTIREAILMTTIVAVLLVWWMERSKNTTHEARLTAIEMRLQSFPITVLPPTKFVVTPGANVPALPTVSPPRIRAHHLMTEIEIQESNQDSN